MGEQRERQGRQDTRDSLLSTIALVVVGAEVLLHRVVVPETRPLRETPPGWHTVLAWAGNFTFYFAAAFAFALIARELVRLLSGDGPHGRWLSAGQAFSGAALLAVTAVVLTSASSESLTFALDAVFTVALLALIVGQVAPGGDLGARIGVVLLGLPLVLHFYAPFALRFISGDDLGLPERIQVFGQWSIVFSALATPYCFAPRPFALSASRLAPLGIALSVTVLAAVLIRRAAVVAMDLARDGLGLVLDPLAPVSMLALYIMALAAVTWATVSCLIAPAPQRRQIGVGIALLLLGGYAFEWPLQYLIGFLGLLLVSRAARRVDGEERAVASVRSSNSGTVGDDDWQEFLSSLARMIADKRMASGKPSLLTVKDEGGGSRTHVVWTEGELRVRLSLVRRDRRLHLIDYIAGDEPADGAPPSWTLSRTRDGVATQKLGPPTCSGAATRSGDAAFDEAFQVRDAGGHLVNLLPDEATRARAIDLLGGWVALWPGVGLRSRITLGVDAVADASPDLRAATKPLCDALALLGEMGKRGR